jgi:hypothetical protein
VLDSCTLLLFLLLLLLRHDSRLQLVCSSRDQEHGWRLEAYLKFLVFQRLELADSQLAQLLKLSEEDMTSSKLLHYIVVS